MNKIELQNESITINGQTIVCPAENGERYIAITPVCRILGIDPESQKTAIKDNPVYSSTPVINTGVATDNKEREMFLIPLKYFFGWIYGINANKVKEEVREHLIKYQKKVIDILYEKFFLEPQFLKMKSEAKLKALTEIQEINETLKEAKNTLKELDEYSYQNYKEDTQTSINFTE